MVSRRQQQLAKYSPRRIIELAYLCALLERRHEGYQSKRFKTIKTFFESAVSVVPLESLFHAIANGTPEIVLQCCEIFCSSNALSKLSLLSEFLLPLIQRAAGRVHHLMQQTEHASGCEVTPHVRYVLKKDSDLLNNTYSRMTELINRATYEHPYQNSPCNINLEVIYPSADVENTHKHMVKHCKAPMTLLTEGRKELNRIGEELLTELSGSADDSSTSNANSSMKVLNGLRTEFNTCSTLLGAFMEAQARIPLEKAGGDKHVDKFAKLASSFGLSVWGLLILPFKYLNQLISRNVSEDFRQFVIEPQFPDYDEKLVFLVGSMKKSWACNQQYVSYSLERQLEYQCTKRNLFHNTPVDKILQQWNDNFENETLTLIPNQYRLLVARWIKWSLMINNLRESLASQTAVGVIGLVNSGKSKFVRSMFGKEVSE